MSSLLREIEAEASGGARRCLLGKALDRMGDEDRASVVEAMTMHNFPSSAIARVLNRRGHKMGENVVRTHRSGACCCGGDPGVVGG